MDPMEALLNKLKIYKGSLLASQWKIPTTKKQFVNCIKRLVKLYYAMQSRNILHPALVFKVKEIAAYFKMYIMSNLPEAGNYLAILEEIENYVPEHSFSRIEYHRVKEAKTCSICKVSLVDPAYIIYTTEEGTEIESQPIGIFCLKSLHGKLDKFVDSMKVEWDVNVIVKGVESDGRTMLKMEIS